MLLSYADTWLYATGFDGLKDYTISKKQIRGKLSDKNNYRPVAISNSLSKVFELILLDRCEEYLWTSGNQFGFKADHSTEMCIYALHEFIDYYRSRSTNVYVTFLDASKAFDRINH